MEIEKKIEEYIISSILPQYESMDKAHDIKHINYVINRSLKLSKKYGANINMAYVIAAFHDLGMTVNREQHEIIGAKILEEDEIINSCFSDKQIILMGNAIKEHRASYKGEYSSIYSKIISQADRNFDINVIVSRTIQYGMKQYPSYTYEEHYKRSYAYLEKKYGINGYVHMILDYEPDVGKLEEVRKYLGSEVEFGKIFKKCYEGFGMPT